MSRVLLVIPMLLLLPCAIWAQSPPTDDPSSPQQLAANLRTLLIRYIPSTLYEARPGWGRTTQIPNGLHWHGQGLHVHPDVSHGERNDGKWKHIRITAESLADSLVVDVRNTRPGAADQKLFDLFLSFDVQVSYIEQVWKTGVKLYDGEVRAKLRVKLNLSCEATTRAEYQGGLLPDLVFRLRVTKADFQYDSLVIQHVAGIGGEAAKVIGDTVLATLRQVHPSLERDMIAKADAAIVKAADTKEIRVGLGNLLGRSTPTKTK
jgi:hypothetical protein